MYLLIVLVAVLTNCAANHFRGGTISWRPLGGYQVEFHYKMGWTYGRGPGCTQRKIGQFVNAISPKSDSWICTQGCPGSPSLHSVNYICVGASQQDDYEEGQMTFNYTFLDSGPFVVAFEGNAWMNLGAGKGSGDWRVATTVDLRTRNDTGRPNSSPVTSSQSIYYMQFDCHHELKIPVLDPDGDKVLCQWAQGNECKTVCNGLPGAILDEETCTIIFNTTAAHLYVPNEFYGVAITIRDYPHNTISLEDQRVNETKTPTDSISITPLQFLIKTPAFPEGCDVKPRFVNPTPAEASTLIFAVGSPVSIDLVADNGINKTTEIQSIDVLGPVALVQSPLLNDSTQINTFYKTLNWTTTPMDVGDHIVCAKAVNVNRKASDPRCFTIKIVIGYCLNDPCKNGGVCYSATNDYVCECEPGYTDKNCATELDECVSLPCLHRGNCTDLVNDFLCSCPPGFTGKNCHIGVDFCETKPCKNRGMCENSFTGFVCHCVDGWQGKVCDYRPSKSQRSGCVKNNDAMAIGKNMMSKQDSCCQATEYNNCECFISPNMQPEEIEGMEQTTRDLLSALIGFPLGLALSFLTYALFWCCVSRAGATDVVQKFRSKHPPTKRCSNSTQKWINDQAAPVESSTRNNTSTASTPPSVKKLSSQKSVTGSTPPPGSAAGMATPMNIYRASFNDQGLHSTGPKKFADTYASGAPDWTA